MDTHNQNRQAIIHLEMRPEDSVETIRRYVDYLCSNIDMTNYFFIVSPLHNPKFDRDTFFLTTDESFYTLEQIPSMIEKVNVFEEMKNRQEAV